MHRFFKNSIQLENVKSFLKLLPIFKLIAFTYYSVKKEGECLIDKICKQLKNNTDTLFP